MYKRQERDALVQACEARAGEALRILTGQEGLSLREAVAWLSLIHISEPTRPY